MSQELTKDWLKIEKVIQETPDTKTLRIGLKQPMDFIPGQFVMAGLNVGDPKNLLVKRAFSIASSPLEKQFIELTFNVVPEGKFSPHLYALKEG
ncbi:MAG TPA: FAD-binding oxidoreductase, partial [archaeon]|nr:FAD-binding oxidoreductase [archaeon]